MKRGGEKTMAKEYKIVNLNKILLVGRLTRDPELRHVPNGSPVTNFGIAVNRRWRDSSGEFKEESCFVTIVCWARLAELCAEHLHKSSMVFVEGRLQSRSWEVEGGDKRVTIEVRADKVQFLDKREKQENQSEESQENN